MQGLKSGKTKKEQIRKIKLKNRKKRKKNLQFNITGKQRERTDKRREKNIENQIFFETRIEPILIENIEHEPTIKRPQNTCNESRRLF